jgi:hypothetical protein
MRLALADGGLGPPEFEENERHLTGQHFGKRTVEDRGRGNRSLIEALVEVSAQIEPEVKGLMASEYLKSIRAGNFRVPDHSDTIVARRVGRRQTGAPPLAAKFVALEVN